MKRTLEETQKLVAKREEAIRLYFEKKETSYAEIARKVETSRQNVAGWIKVELAQRKKK